MKYNSKGHLAEVWDAPVAGKNMFVPHKVILNAVQDTLYVADRENNRVLSFSTSGGRGSVLSGEEEVGGSPYSIFFNGSSSNTGGTDWPMYGVLGGFSSHKLLGFALDSSGKRIGTWGPQEVGVARPSGAGGSVNCGLSAGLQSTPRSDSGYCPQCSVCDGDWTQQDLEVCSQYVVHLCSLC